VAGHRPAAPNHHGAHYLRDHALIDQLVRASRAGPGQLVLDLGAGHGAVTVALAASGARVIAVERDPRAVAKLRRRLASRPQVSVVTADVRELPLPRRDFLVVASIPFAVTTLLLRRLAGDPAVPLRGAELVTGWGAARRFTSVVPPTVELAWWAARYRMRLVRRVTAQSFSPPPRVAAAHLSVRPRLLATSPSGQRLLRRLLPVAYRNPQLPARQIGAEVAAGGHPVSRAAVRDALARSGVDPRAPAAGLTAEQWHDVVLRLARSADLPAAHRQLPR
jgi:16S rRNA A1518/A1519 N6-dimethyltransferase RsmA/KsgA/DIM1 with predicted DNA glycosylase/AP lyase activity